MPSSFGCDPAPFRLRLAALLSVSGLALAAAAPAHAACTVVEGSGTPENPSTGARIVCEGTVAPAASIGGPLAAIDIRSGASVVFGLGGGFSTGQGTIVNNGVVEANNGTALEGLGDDSRVTNNGVIRASGSTGAAMAIGGTGQRAVLTNNGLIETNDAYAMAGFAVNGVTIVNTGTIRRMAPNASNAAVLGATLFTNSGTIEGLGTDSVGVRAVGEVVNSGRIATTGIALDTIISLTNTGVIETTGAGTTAVFAGPAAKLVNHGTIRSSSGHALQSQGITLANVPFNGVGGVIETGSAAHAAVFDQAGLGFFENHGTIRNTAGGYAIDTVRQATLGRLVLGTTSVIEGRVRFSSGEYTLELAGTGEGTFDLSVLGTTWDIVPGNFRTEKTGPSTWTLTGAHGTPWDLRQGTLLVAGSAGGVTGAAGTVLGGTGTIRGFDTSGTVAPGSGGIGVLTATDNVVFRNGSRLSIEVDGASADRVSVGNQADLNGATVDVVARGALPPVGNTRHTILSAAGGLNNTRFTGLTGASAFIHPSLSYTSTEVLLDVTRIAFTDPSVVQTSNQAGVAGAIEGLRADNAILAAILRLQTGEARLAFDQLSGSAQASATGLVAREAGRSADTVLARLRAAPAFTLQDRALTSYAASGALAAPPRGDVALWGEAVGAWGRAPGMSSGTGGLVAGAEWGTGGPYRIGFAGTYTATSFDAPALLASGSIENAAATLYGAARWGGLALRAGASLGHHGIDVSRAVSVPGLSGAARGERSATSLLAFAEAGYRVDLGGMAVEPFAGLQHLHVSGGRLAETGTAMALSGHVGGLDAAASSLGVHASATGGALTARATLAWRHAFGDVTPAAAFAFAAGSQPFLVAGAPLARDALRVEAGLDYAVTTGMSLNLAYEGEVGRRAQEHALRGGFTVRF